jgi:hypothetical protein
MEPGQYHQLIHQNLLRNYVTISQRVDNEKNDAEKK